MADNTKIEWADATINAVNGCSVISPGCTNCYAMRLAGTRLRELPSRAGLTKPSKAGPVWTGKVKLNEGQLLQPLRWRRPRRIFWNAHGDLFHDAVPDEWIDRVFAVCALTPQHTHMILTKRTARMRRYFMQGLLPSRLAVKVSDLDPSFDFRGWQFPFPNVWLGASVEDQLRADERLPDLRETPAAVRFISFEPLLGAVEADFTGIHWAIVGGESGPSARPMHPDWARSLRDQCAAAGVAFFFKQWGEWASVYDRDRDDPQWNKVPKPGDWDRKRWLNLAGGQGFHGDKLNMMRRVGKKRAGRLLDGHEHSEFPA